MNKIKFLRENLKNDEAILIISPQNRFYLTSFNSSAGAVFITKNKAMLLVDFRYFEAAKSAALDFEVVLLKSLSKQVKELCVAEKIGKLFVETDYISLSDFEGYKKAFDGIEVSCEDTAQRLILQMRSIKSNTELENIKKAQEITDKTFSYILNNIKVGRSELDIMLDMEFYMRKLGSEGVSFDFIVVSGKNSSLPHGVPTDKAVENGDFITMDFGAVVNGYHSDMTRTVALGYVTEEQQRVYDTVLSAQEAALKAIKPNVVCKDIDKIARDIIDNAGYIGCFGHGLGHSVGIEIHENPSFNTRCETKLSEGMVMTVEPGIYLENKFGVRIEDMVFVTQNGNTDITQSEKKLIII